MAVQCMHIQTSAAVPYTDASCLAPETAIIQTSVAQNLTAPRTLSSTRAMLCFEMTIYHSNLGGSKAQRSNCPLPLSSLAILTLGC